MLAGCLIAITTISGFALYSIQQYQAAEIREEHAKLESGIRTFRELLGYKGNGFRVVNDQFFVGDYLINNNFELPDKVQEIFGGEATIFLGDQRISTNVRDGGGKRAVGTRLVGPAHRAIFKEGRPYRGEARVLGIPYLTAYDPIRDRDGRIVGALFVGIRESEFIAGISGLKNHMVLWLFAILTIFTIIMGKLGREMQKIARRNEQQLTFQQTLIDTIPNPVFCKDTAFRYTGCNKAFESYIGYSKDELLGKTADELWPKELADHYLQQDRLLFENPGLQCYEGSTRFADGTVRDVIFNKATFNDSDGSVQGLVGVMLDITERKRAEEAVAFQNILLSTQQEASIDGILVVNENAEILSINRRFIEIMGIPAHLLEEKEDEPVLAHVTTLMVDPRQFQEKVRYLYEHRLEFSRDELSLCDGKTLDRYTVPLLSPDGRYYGRLWSFRDITERKAAEDKTKNACQELLDIIEFLPDATFVVDNDKRVIAWNRAIEKMTGLNKEAVMGKGNNVYSTPFYGEPRPILIDLVDETLDVISVDYPAIIREGRTLFTEAFVPLFRNGGSRFFWATASPLLDIHGKMVGAIESIRDITEYKRAGEEKLRLESQLSHTQIMETLLVRLGHDLKTPLTPLLMLLPLIKNRVSDPKSKKMVDMCCENITCIKALAEKYKMFVSLVSSIKPYEYQNITLVSAVEECLAESAASIGAKDLSCQISVDPLIVVPVVPDQLKELLSNLVSNAVHYSPEQGVIYIAAEQHADVVTISLRDEGIGLTADHRERIFDEFFKADESRHELGTSGLGLSICKRIVWNHHGRIWAESAGLGRGTTIIFTLHQHSNAMQHSEKETVTNG